VVLENKNFVNYLNSIDGVNAFLASPGHLSVKNGKVLCRDKEATTIFMDFNSDTLLKMAKNENIEPIKEAVKQGILINLGMENAKKEVLNTKFVQGDARDTGLPDKYFWVIIIMGNSFGYFLDECENTNILHEVFRLLMQNGSLFLDLPNKEYVLRNFNPQSWHEANEDIVVCRQRKFENDIIFSRELVVSKKDGLMRDINYYTRIYGEKQISEVLSSTGFSSVTIKKDFVSHEKNGDYGCMTNRMIVTAHKK
jgi:D-alanine-D-alanine ligase